MSTNLLLAVAVVGLVLKEVAACHATCLTCLTPDTGLYTECVTCKPGAQLTPIAPSPCACSSRYYASPDASNCVACASTCNECLAGGAAQCKNCNLNASLTGAIPSTCACNLNFYPNPDASSCDVCSPACKTCTGKLAKDCSACVLHGTMGGAGCTCDDGYWLNTVTNNCEPCNYICQKCTAAGLYDCSGCFANANVSGGTCACDNQFYPSPEATNCLACHNTCQNCSGGASTQCSTCKANAALASGVAPGSCICNNGYYPSPDASSCQVCNSQCSTCSGPNYTQCLTCITNSALKAAPPSECECLPGYTPATTVSNCVLCHADCVTCFGPAANQCLTCGSHAHLVGATPTNCVCDDGYGQNPDAQHCMPCHSACLKCANVLITGCTACKLQAHLTAAAPSACICDNGLYNSPDASSCAACDTSCSTCNGSGPSACTGCKTAASLLLGVCSCNAGYYGAPDASNCVACEPTCGTCTLVSPLTCSGCKVGAIAASGGGCACTTGYFGSPDARNCVACNPTCATCSTTGSTSCDTCKPGAEFVEGKSPGTCVCSTGHYTTTDASNCQPCNSKCYKCVGPAASDCKECKNGATLVGSIPGQCSCSANGYFPLPDASNCVACDRTCRSCSGSAATSCTVCYEHAALVGAAPSSCACISGYLPMPHTGFCRCDDSCSTCVSTTSTSCISCYSHAHLLAAPGPSQCVCDNSYYPNPLPNQCTDCHYTCATCSGPSSTQCTTCGSRAKMTAAPPASCYCDPGYGMFGRNCELCYTLCADCKGTTANSCTACKSPLQLAGGLTMSSCDCPPYYFMSSMDPLECSKCPEKCYTCYDFEHCITCNPSYYKYSGDCYSSCPKGTQVMGSECRDCYEGCATCSGALKTECLTCLPWFNFTSLSTCLECPVGQYYSADNTCTQCSKDCDMCEDEDYCISCSNPAKVPRNGECMTNPCPPLCTFCSADQCTECTVNAVIANSTCECTEGFMQMGESCIPLYQECASIATVNATDLILTSRFQLADGDLRIQLVDNSTNTVVEVNSTVTLLNSTQSIFYTDVKLNYDDSSLTPGATEIVVKFVYLIDCASPYDKAARADLIAAFPIIREDTWGLSATFKQFSRVPQYFIIGFFFISAITGRRRAFWALYNVLLLISYQGLLSMSLHSDVQKFMLTVSRLSLLPNFFNPILASTASESSTTAPLSQYGDSHSDILSDTFLVHSGTVVSVGIILALLFPVGKVLQRLQNPRLNQMGNRLVGSFKFNYFLRFAIEHYVIFAYAGLDQLKHFGVGSVGNAISSIVAIAVVDVELQPFKEKWSTLLGEFKGLSYYYVAFLLRRLVLAYVIVFLSTSVVQLAINAATAVAVSTTQLAAFVVVTRPFEGRFHAVVQTFEECSNAVISCLLLLYLPEVKRESNALLYALTAQVVAHIAMLVVSTALGLVALMHQAKAVAPQEVPPSDVYERMQLHETEDANTNRAAGPALDFTPEMVKLPGSVAQDVTRAHSTLPDILPPTPPIDQTAPDDKKPLFSKPTSPSAIGSR